MNDLVDVLVRYGYLVVFGWVFAEQIGLPIPAMPVLLAAGAIAGTGRLSLVLVSAGISLARERPGSVAWKAAASSIVGRIDPMSRPDRAVFEDPQGSVSYPSGHQI